MFVNRINLLKEKLKIKAKREEVKKLQGESSQAGFWRDSALASKKMQKLAELQKEIEEVEELERFYHEDKKEAFQKALRQLELRTFLAGQYDGGDAVLSLYAGQGGVEAMDWTEMLKRMYIRFLERKKWKWEIVEEVAGEEAGIKSITFIIRGKFAYGFLKGEAGTHRLVRQSPFNADKLRQTSFALVEVLPELEEIETIELKEEDLQIDTFKSTGHGGQSVNTTDSAVRIKHLPTGLTVTCRNERSQLQNKQIALRILKSKLKQYEQAELEEEKKKLRGEFSEAAWGNQIRSYVLHPYKLVKDHRTNYETQEVEKVLNGELNEFVEAYLKQSSHQNSKIIK